MTTLEKAEIRRLPERYKPLGAWGYFWYSVLFAIPVIGFIALIVCAVCASNINLRSYARSFFVGFIMVIIAIIVVLLLSYDLLIDILTVLQG